MKNPCFAVSDYASFGLHQLALLICSIWLCRKLLCFKYLLATGSAAYHFRQRRSRHRRRNQRHPAAEGQALRGARPKALLALDFCLCVRGHSCNSFIQMHICGTARVFHPGEEFQRGRSCKPDSQYATTDTCRSTQGFPKTAKPPIFISQSKNCPHSLRREEHNHPANSDV